MVRGNRKRLRFPPFSSPFRSTAGTDASKGFIVAEIKSTLELALEKADRIGKASSAEMQSAARAERARHLAADFLREKCELEGEVAKLSPDDKPEMLALVKDILLRNVTLPRAESSDPACRRALAGMLQVARDKKAMQRLIAEVNNVFKSFDQVRANALQQLKANFGAQLDGVRRAYEAQTHMKVNLDVEHLPQFQDEWRKFETQLVQQFEPVLDRHKAQMALL